MPEPYRSNWEHLGAELERVKLAAHRLYLRLRSGEPARFEDSFRGLRITAAEMEVALAGRGSEADGPSGTRLAELEADINRREEASLAAGVELRLPRLAALFGLDRLCRDCLLVCLAPEVEPGFEKIFAYLQDDVTKRSPRVHLIFDLLGLEGEERLEARRLFQPTSPLLAHRLLGLEGQGPLPGHALRLEPRVAEYLLGGAAVEPAISGAVRLAGGEDRLEEMILPEGVRGRLARVERYLAGGGRLPVLFWGPRGTGKKTAALSLCARLGLPLLVCDVGRLGGQEALGEQTALLRREAVLREAALYLDGVEGVSGPQIQAALVSALQGLPQREFPHPVFLGHHGPECHGWWELACLPLQFPLPTYGEGALIWRGELGERPELYGLANKFRLSGGQVRQATERARGLSVLAGEEGLSTETLHQACRLASTARLNQLARRIEPRYGWEDIVLSGDAKRQLREMCDQLRHRHVVYEIWGFARTAPRGKGLTALFVGESGTGKTMAAEIMAAELKLDLYKIDLSAVVSKYIGETEKNLEKIFSEAAQSNAILFFDEADAIFGKRSEVKDAHDRYANIEISYLLQRMEDYEGIVILASNLRANIDDAFTRRMQFVVEFPFPEEADRLAIWGKVFPPEAPGAEGLELAALAAQLKLAGGNIRNIAQAAAFLAASDGGRLNMDHVRHAVRREFQKMGRLHLKAGLEGQGAARDEGRRDEGRDEEGRRQGI